MRGRGIPPSKLTKANATVFERFRMVLSNRHRVQYMIEVLMQVRKDKYKDNPILPEGIHPVEEHQITHEIQLEEDSKASVRVLSATPAIFLNSLPADIFEFDPNYLENEEKYKAIKADILREGPSDNESGSEESDSEGEDEGIVGRLVPFLLPY